jgi:predicted helicase
MLHHPEYRTHFAESLQREIPHISLVEDFRKCSNIGARLIHLHLNYETIEPFKLRWVESRNLPLSLRVQKMKLMKEEGAIFLNDTLSLTGIPASAFAYALGTRTALEWLVDQYQVAANGETISDPNDPNDEDAIVRLIGQVTTVSVETVKLIKELPSAIQFRGFRSPSQALA